MVPQSISEFPLPSGLLSGVASCPPPARVGGSPADTQLQQPLLLPPTNASLGLESLPADLCLQMFRRVAPAVLLGA